MSNTSPELKHASQLGFSAAVFEHPLTQLGVDAGVVDILQKEPHWQNITGSHAAIVDPIHDQAVIVDLKNRIPSYNAKTITMTGITRLGGIAIYNPQLQDPESYRAMLATYAKPLAPGGVFLVIEKRSDEENIGLRKKILQDAGYAHVGISHRGDFVIWHATRPLGHKHTKIDVWSAEKAGPVAQEYLETAKTLLTTAGFKVVGTQPIQDRLQSSRYVIRDLQFAREGYGIRVIAPCGCEMTHTFDSEWKVEQETDMDCNHRGLEDAIKTLDRIVSQKYPDRSVKKFRPPLVIQPVAPPHEEIIGSHGGCGGTLRKVAIELRQITRHGEQYTHYQVDLECSSCGYQGIGGGITRFVDVPVVPN